MQKSHARRVYPVLIKISFTERSMKASSYERGAARSWRLLVVFISAMFLGSLSAAALPEPGTPAPPLQFTQLLQAPPGTKTDWESLRGKVVVLEFWETQCAPCIAEIPHLSKLIAELDPAKFQFISVDGLPSENEEVVQKFLTKRKMPGWVGVDTSGSVFASYGVRMYPTTIIVDGQGRVVAVTRPEILTTSDLQAVADGKTVKFASMPVFDVDALRKSGAPTSDATSLFELSITKAPPDAPFGMSYGGGRIDINGMKAKELISFAYQNLPKDRFLPTCVFPEGLYNLHTACQNGEDNDNLIPPFLQIAIAYGLNLRIESKTVTQKAYVLKATEASKKLLTPTASTGGSMWMYSNGRLTLKNRSIDNLANSLEGGLEVPIVNETGIEGKFDVELEFPAKDVEAAKTALLKTLGLDLIEAERPIQMLEVSPRAETKKAEEAKPHEPPQK
jgi:uncharacterized protein (TIGR03435 family)